MGQIGNLAEPPGKVIVFQGWQGLHEVGVKGGLRKKLGNDNGNGEGRV